MHLRSSWCLSHTNTYNFNQEKIREKSFNGWFPWSTNRIVTNYKRWKTMGQFDSSWKKEFITSLTKFQLLKVQRHHGLRVGFRSKACWNVFRLLNPQLMSNATGSQLLRQIHHLSFAFHLKSNLQEKPYKNM